MNRRLKNPSTQGATYTNGSTTLPSQKSAALLYQFTWEERFEHFEQSFILLQRAVQTPLLNDTDKAALIPFFELTFELSWKFVKEYLAFKDIDTLGPKQAIEKGLELHLLYGRIDWEDALTDRDLSRQYSFENITANQALLKINQVYLPMFNEFYTQFCTNHGVKNKSLHQKPQPIQSYAHEMATAQLKSNIANTPKQVANTFVKPTILSISSSIQKTP